MKRVLTCILAPERTTSKTRSSQHVDSPSTYSAVPTRSSAIVNICLYVAITLYLMFTDFITRVYNKINEMCCNILSIPEKLLIVDRQVFYNLRAKSDTV